MRASTLPITLLALFLLSVASTDRIPFHRTPNPSGVGSSFLIQASHLRNVPINNSTKTVGFYVNVDLANNADTKETPSSASMIIALYSSNTLLASTCEKFYKYDCEKHHCKDSGEVATTDYPYFSAEGNSITANMVLEKSSWILGSNAIFATKCTGSIQDLGFGTTGIIGLGVEKLAAKNYRKKDIQFSIFLKQDVSQGELIFSKDFSKALNETAVAVFPANNNWHILGKITVGVGKAISFQNPNGKVIFDLHADATGFPLITYKNILATWPQFVKDATIECLKDEHYYYRPVCTYKDGEVPVFPELSVAYGPNGEQKIVLTPDMFIEEVKGETPSVRLNIRALSSTLTKKENYVTQAYEDYIILDSSILAAYYTVFEVDENGKNNIALYPANHKAENNSNSTIAFIILGVFVVLLLFFGFLTYSSYLKKQKARDGLFTNSSLFDQAKRMDHSLASSTS